MSSNSDKDDSNTLIYWACGVALVLAIIISFIVLYFVNEGYYMWHPGYYPGYWGYRVPPWQRRWWWRRRFYGMPLARRRRFIY